MDHDYFDVTVVVNYYSPYVSGLTETARIVAEGLARRGWKIAVVATQHEPGLPKVDTIAGVHVFRASTLFKIGRGPVSPGFLRLVRSIAKRSKALHLHLPMLEASAITITLPRVPIVSTYHIDLWLAPSLMNRLQIAVVNHSARFAIKRSDRVVVNSEDQAKYSLLWPEIANKNWSSIPAPCLDPREGTPTYRDGDGYHVGFLGRIVPDKGIEYLIRAFLRIAKNQDRLLLGGEYLSVAGGSNISELKQIAGNDSRVRFLGPLNREETRNFYASIDTFALTSVAESFGIVQAEAMMCGLPVVGSNLPGGRVPIVQTGFGILTEPCDVEAIATALSKLQFFPKAEKVRLAELARSLFGSRNCINRYAELFSNITNEKQVISPTHSKNSNKRSEVRNLALSPELGGSSKTESNESKGQ